MENKGTLKVTTPGDREIAMTRAFAVPRRLLFEGLTKPALLQQWLLGPPGWSMPICEVDLRVGGTYRYVWRGQDSREMGMTGIYSEVVRPERLVGTEKFDDEWYPGEAIGTHVLVEEGGQTILTLTMMYESREIRDAVLKTPMEEGVGASYDRLARLLSSR